KSGQGLGPFLTSSFPPHLASTHDFVGSLNRKAGSLSFCGHSFVASALGFALASVRRNTSVLLFHKRSNEASSSKIRGASGNFDPYQMLLHCPFRILIWR